MDIQITDEIPFEVVGIDEVEGDDLMTFDAYAEEDEQDDQPEESTMPDAVETPVSTPQSSPVADDEETPESAVETPYSQDVIDAIDNLDIHVQEFIEIVQQQDLTERVDALADQEHVGVLILTAVISVIIGVLAGAELLKIWTRN